MATRPRTRVGLLLTVLVVAAIAAACTPGGSASQVSAPPAPASTGVTETGPVTLTVWDQECCAVSKVWDQLNAEFEAKYPNVTIERVNRDFGELKTLLKLSMQGPHGPDVVEANQGWPDMGQLVKAGLLLPLDNYAQAYGWTNRVSDNVHGGQPLEPGRQAVRHRQPLRVHDDGRDHRRLLQQAEAVRPRPHGPDDVRRVRAAISQVAKDAGEIPIQFGNNDAFPGIHEYAVIQDQLAATSRPHRLHLRDPGQRRCASTRPRTSRPRTTLQDWATKGYFTPGFGGARLPDRGERLRERQGLFMITGNWIVGEPRGGQHELRVLPDAADERRAIRRSRPAARGSRCRSPRESEHPDAAAAYIDWMTSDHASELLLPDRPDSRCSKSETGVGRAGHGARRRRRRGTTGVAEQRRRARTRTGPRRPSTTR